MNWFFHQDKVFGYHLVNFLIHFLSTIFLFKSCLLLLSTPKMKGRAHGNRFLIAALAALFWAFNPVQTQAVTYIVQRMASLAAMFTIIGIWCYLKARRQQGNSIKKKLFYYIGLLLAFLLALGAKENAILLPASLVLIELFFLEKPLNSPNKILSFSRLAFFLSWVLPSF
ncbi:MAG: hypothetical protein QTN59_05185 [Candidatus Electrothrix communis]|nr:MAG: hypothetical protein QTN59_05185 [Candidatus Electrothrix communis]